MLTFVQNLNIIVFIKQMLKINNLYCTGTMRTGGSLVSNLLSIHKDLIIITDIIHFFRYIYKKYDPIDQNHNLYRLSAELSLRLKLRDDLKIDKKIFYKKFIKNNVKTYGEVYSSIFEVLLKKIPKKKFIGEYANGEWKSIGDFLSFNKKNVAVHVIRDPRAMLSSWKRITFSKGHKYLNSIFNWIDSADSYEKYKKKFGNKRYLLIKFEDIHKNPEKISRKLCNFLDLSFDKNMIKEKKWKSLLKNKFNYINETAYGKKNKVYGFSKNRIHEWKKNLSKWEINLVNHLCKKRIKKLGYKTEKIDKKLLVQGIYNIKKDKFLSKQYKYFLKHDEGFKYGLNDPTDPKNWESRLKPGTKFIHSSEYKIYKKELINIKKYSKKLKK